MRNLKKILALVLALVMSLSLVTIANAADFTDADEIDYEEAVDVMSTIGVINGMDDGSYDPDGILTREQAAKMITYMLLGSNAEKLGVESSTFKDVAATRWSAPAIEYCASLGIIDGAGDGNFYPATKLTGYAFAKMLLTALGYSSEKEGMTGPSWSVNVAALAIDVGLDQGLENGISSAELSRQEAAQMALNAIKTPLVAYDNDTTIVVNGAEVSIGSGSAYYVTTTLAKEQRISKQTLSNTGEYTVEFGERYFPKLELKLDTDPFNRPSYTWIYNGDDIGTYVDYTLLKETYTVGVKGSDMYDLLGRTIVTDDDYTLTVYVDGAEYVAANTTQARAFIKENFTRNNSATMDNTGKGALTQVFLDTDAEEIIVTVINTYLAEATADYNKTTERLPIRVYNTAAGTTKTLVLDDFAAIADYQEGDFLLVNWADDTDNVVNKEVVKISDVEVISDASINKFSIDKYVVSGGEQYDYAVEANYSGDVLNQYDNSLLTNKTYNIYLDQYGYLIGVDLYSGEANYVFITGYDLNASNITTQTADAAAIFTDGTMKTIQVDVKETNKKIQAYNDNSANDYRLWQTGLPEAWAYTNTNTWYTYTLDESNNIYTLAPVAANRQMGTPANSSVTINSKNVRLDGTNARVDGAPVAVRAYGNDDSAYITVDTDTVNSQANVIDEVTGIYTGVQNVDIVSRQISGYETVYAVVDDDLYVIAAVVIGEDNGSTSNYAYIFAGANYEEKIGDTYYWEFDAATEEGFQKLTVKTKYSSVITTIVNTLDKSTNGGNAAGDTWANGYLFKLSYDAEGYVVNAKLYDDTTLANSYIFVNDGNNWNTAIGTQVVRYMNVGANTTDSDQLILISNTLYNNDETLDKGLPLHPDAKFIVAQDEYGTFTKTEYDTIEAALSALYDYDQTNNTPNETLDFNGTISAVLDSSGRATWVVFDSNGGFDADRNPSGGNGSTEVRYVEVDTINNIIYLDSRDMSKGSAATVDAAAKAALASIGWKATTSVNTSSSPDWTITATNMNSGNTTAFTFSIRWK